MNSGIDNPKPTIADEVSPVVDDGVVIEKTLPAAAPPVPPGNLDNALAAARSYISANPACAALMAAGGGALLMQILVLSLRRRPRSPR